MDVTTVHGIPVTSPVRTFLDLATRLDLPGLERAINEADKLGVIDPERLRAEIERRRGQRGAPKLRHVLDRATFRLTESELERRLLPLAAKAGLSQPTTGARVNGYKVDFFWPELGLVVETDGLRYHRTPAQQARDRLRDQAHLAAGLAPLRFTPRAGPLRARARREHARSGGSSPTLGQLTVPGFICILEIGLHFPTNGSLKGKRRELRPLKAALQRRFGAAVAETDHHDLWQRATLSAAIVGREHGEVADAAAAIERFVHASFPDGARVEAHIRSSEDFV